MHDILPSPKPSSISVPLAHSTTYLCQQVVLLSMFGPGHLQSRLERHTRIPPTYNIIVEDSLVRDELEELAVLELELFSVRERKVGESEH
jgi:hypothetical protein